MIREKTPDGTIKSYHFDKSKVYYVYAWYYGDTGEVFYVGKGKNKRYLERKAHRNQYFINILNKEGDNAKVKFLIEGLSEVYALENERRIIKEYNERGECKANLHEGGCGGNTGNYDNPERSRRIREALKRLYANGYINPHTGVPLSPEHKERLRQINLGRKPSQKTLDAIRRAITGRIKTPEELAKISAAHKGKKLTERQYYLMMLGVSDFVYAVYYKEKIAYLCIGQTHLHDYFDSTFNLSRTIANNIIGGDYDPHFGRMKFAKDTRIDRIPKEYASELLRMLDGRVDHKFFDPGVRAIHKRHSNGVIQYDLSGNKIAEFQSLKEAAEKSGTKDYLICKCCRGINKICNGFVWRYIGDPFKL